MGLTPQQPQQGASSQMPFPQTAPPRRESQCRPSLAASPGFGWQPMPYTRPRPYHRASSPTASLVPQSAQVPGNLRVIVRAIKVPPFVFGLQPLYTTGRTMSSVGSGGAEGERRIKEELRKKGRSTQWEQGKKSKEKLKRDVKKPPPKRGRII